MEWEHPIVTVVSEVTDQKENFWSCENGCSVPSQISLPTKEKDLFFWPNNLPGFAILNKDSCSLLVFHFPLIFQRIRVNINSAFWCQQNPWWETGMCYGTGGKQFWVWDGWRHQNSFSSFFCASALCQELCVTLVNPCHMPKASGSETMSHRIISGVKYKSPGRE